MTVPTANTERYSFLLETNLGAGRPTFLAGASGAGKTMLAAQVSPFCFADVGVSRPRASTSAALMVNSETEQEYGI